MIKRFALYDDHDQQLLGYASDLICDDLLPYRKTGNFLLKDFSLDTRLLDPSQAHRQWRRAYLRALDEQDRTLTQTWLFDCQNLQEDALRQHPGTDLTLRARSSSPNFGLELAIWRQIPAHGITDKNRWRQLDPARQRAWSLVMLRHFKETPAHIAANDDVVLNGDLIDDYPSFFCAIGEAANGPGGYYGSNLDALVDCLRGDFGRRPPFKLIWKNAGRSLKVLDSATWQKEKAVKAAMYDEEDDEAENAELQPIEPLFYVILDIFLEAGVKVVLEP